MLDGVVNFRDIGGPRTADGRTVRTGWVYRSAHFGDATDADIAELERRNVKLFIDFRGPGDIEADGHNRMPAGARLVSIPMFDPAAANDIRLILATASPDEMQRTFGGGRAHEAMVKGAIALVVQDDRRAGYARMLRSIIDADTPSVIHCSAGKDRTGWGASLMLLLLGVPEAAVIEHYLESNHHRRRAKAIPTRPGVDLELLRPFTEVRSEYARAAIDAVHEHFGGIEGYVRNGLGIDAASVDAFRAQMLR